MYQDFPSIVFCLTVRKKVARQHFRVSLISGIEYFYAPGGYVANLRRKFFELQHQNISYRNTSLLCFRKVLVAKKFLDKGQGKHQDLSSQVFCPTVPKNAAGNI